MVYPENYIASSEGGREIVDDRDTSIPIVILARHGSSDHIQPCFPSPGQIRSMFNTSKINACPEYASSPSTMSDPMEWQPSRQVDFLEERLMRIHQWDNSAYQSRPYEGQTVAVANLNQSEGNRGSAVYGFESPSRDILYGVDDVSTVNVFDNYYENQSERSGQSDQTKDDDDTDHREYDVEEYVECITLTDASENSSRVFNEENLNNNENKIQTINTTSMSNQEVLDAESFERQKQLEKFFNLNVKEHDNAFIGELKTVLMDKLKKYLVQKDGTNKCTFADDIRRVADILNRAINDKDSVLCDKVHELCLRLRDILILKDEILSNAPAENVTNSLVSPQLDTDFSSLNNLSSDNSTFAQASSLETMNNEKITMVHTFNKESDIRLQSTIQTKKESFESLIKFSRIPVLKNKFIRNSEINRNTSKDTVKAKTCARTPTTKLILNSKPENKVVSNYRDDYNRFNKRTTSKYSKDILQQKEEILKKAEALGLLDGVNNISKIPHLTERAQLTLLEKQIQGKLKNKQLALERKKVGLRDRVSTLKLTNSSSSHRFGNVKLNCDSWEINRKIQNNVSNDNTLVSAMTPAGTVTDECQRPGTQTKNETANNVNIEQTDVMPRQEITETHVLNRIELNEMCNDPVVEPSSCLCNKSVPPKLTITSLDTWSSNTEDQSLNSLKDNTQEREEILVRSIACNTDEAEVQPEMPRRLFLEPSANWPTTDQSLITAPTQRRLVLDSRRPLMLFSLLIMAVAFLFYFNQQEIFDLVEQCRLISNDIWQKLTKYQLSNTLNNQIKDLRKYMKQKCELL